MTEMKTETAAAAAGQELRWLAHPFIRSSVLGLHARALPAPGLARLEPPAWLAACGLCIYMSTPVLRGARHTRAGAPSNMEELLKLPSRGNLVNGVAKFGAALPTKYICVHNTDPPRDQVIKTDPTNILIRALKQRRKGKEAPLAPSDVNRKEEPNTATSAAKEKDKGKRPIATDSRPTKRPNTNGNLGTAEFE
eukprot:scaffold266_cov391-Prasinococcus_capsulatus_cf.AAC.9